MLSKDVGGLRKLALAKKREQVQMFFAMGADVRQARRLSARQDAKYGLRLLEDTVREAIVCRAEDDPVQGGQLGGSAARIGEACQTVQEQPVLAFALRQLRLWNVEPRLQQHSGLEHHAQAPDVPACGGTRSDQKRDGLLQRIESRKTALLQLPCHPPRRSFANLVAAGECAQADHLRQPAVQAVVERLEAEAVGGLLLRSRKRGLPEAVSAVVPLRPPDHWTRINRPEDCFHG